MPDGSANGILDTLNFEHVVDMALLSIWRICLRISGSFSDLTLPK